MTWDEIYEAADGCGFGDEELIRKDQARFEIVNFVENNFGFNIEREYEEGVIECVEDWLDDYVEKYNIIFDTKGNIIEHSKVTFGDKMDELIMFYDELPDRDDKEFDTLDIALNLIRDMNKYYANER